MLIYNDFIVIDNKVNVYYNTRFQNITTLFFKIIIVLINNLFYFQGCIYALTRSLETHLNILGAVGLGICILQVFGMIFSCCLYVKLRDVID